MSEATINVPDFEGFEFVGFDYVKKGDYYFIERSKKSNLYTSPQKHPEEWNHNESGAYKWLIYRKLEPIKQTTLTLYPMSRLTKEYEKILVVSSSLNRMFCYTFNRELQEYECLGDITVSLDKLKTWQSYHFAVIGPIEIKGN
jgi:hypothetical protein